MKTDKVRKDWELRSKKYGKNIEGVLFKSFPKEVNAYFDKWSYAQVKKILNNKRRMKILDLGCGYGRLSSRILTDFPRASVRGLDISSYYVKLFNTDLSPRGRAVRGNFTKIPYPDRTFDAAFIVASLIYLVDESARDKFFSELFRVLKVGGRVVIIERNQSGFNLLNIGGLIPLLRGKKNLEIASLNFTVDYMNRKFKEYGGNIEKVEGIGLWTLTLPFSFIVGQFSQSPLRMLMKVINKLDQSLRLVWPSLYVSYQGTRIR